MNVARPVTAAALEKQVRGSKKASRTRAHHKRGQQDAAIHRGGHMVPRGWGNRQGVAWHTPSQALCSLGPQGIQPHVGQLQLTAGHQQAVPAVPSGQRSGQQVRNASQSRRSGQQAVPSAACPQAAGGPHGRGARQCTQQQRRHLRRRTPPLLPETRRGGGNWLAGGDKYFSESAAEYPASQAQGLATAFESYLSRQGWHNASITGGQHWKHGGCQTEPPATCSQPRQSTRLTRS